MQTRTMSAAVTLDSGGSATIVDQQKVVKKEEPEDEGYLCKIAGCIAYWAYFLIRPCSEIIFLFFMFT